MRSHLRHCVCALRAPLRWLRRFVPPKFVCFLCLALSLADTGPAGILSWLLAGIGCVFSGLSYAELSSIMPTDGGTYAYAFVALGELPAIITAWCLTLEVHVSFHYAAVCISVLSCRWHVELSLCAAG